MSRFEDMVKHFKADNSLTRPSATDMHSLRKAHAGIPDDYVNFIEVVGFGNLGDIQLYEGPTAAATVYPNATGRLANVLLIGDDFQGYCFGFDPTDNWRIVEVDPRGSVDTSVEQTFTSLLSAYM